GSLPPDERVALLLEEAFERYRGVADGANSTVYPALARVRPELFGVAVANVAGRVAAVDDAEFEFPIMNVAEPFTSALVCDAIGVEAAHRAIGANATGLPFNALEAVERGPDGRTNPMVNSGAIVTVGLVPGAGAEECWMALRQGLSRFAGRGLE